MTRPAVSGPTDPRTENPAISVVMPVHNALPHLDEAVQSILDQTLSDFEFVILDDGSTDGSTQRLREWAERDSRIRLLEVKDNLGPALSSELVARSARAPIVARMDADDLSTADRLQQKYDLLQENPNVGVVGSLFDIVDKGGRKIRGAETWRLARKSWFVPFGHIIMYRREVFERAGGYRKECEFWEDQDLVSRMAEISKIMVIPRSLYVIRQSGTSTRLTSEQLRLERALDLMYRSLERAQHHQSYDDLLQQPLAANSGVDPRVFISLGSVMLWANERPRLFRRLLARGRLGFDLRSISALVWTAWASFSPGTLRPFLLFLMTLRNVVAAQTVATDRPVLWSRPQKSRSPGPALEPQP